MAKKNTKRAKPMEGYVVAFYMRPEVGNQEPIILADTLARTFSTYPELARLKWCDGVHKGRKEWAKYRRAGWRIRKVKIIDMGDA